MAQLPFEPLRDLVGGREFGLKGVIDERLHQVIYHRSGDLRIAVGVIDFQQTCAGSDLHLQVALKSPDHISSSARRVFKTCMSRIPWPLWAHQPHDPSHWIEVR